MGCWGGKAQDKEDSYTNRANFSLLFGNKTLRFNVKLVLDPSGKYEGDSRGVLPFQCCPIVSDSFWGSGSSSGGFPGAAPLQLIELASKRILSLGRKYAVRRERAGAGAGQGAGEAVVGIPCHSQAREQSQKCVFN